MYTCPHCGNRLEYLRYSVPSTEYGSVDIRRDSEGCVDTYNWDTDDTHNDGDYRYECPDCNEEVDLDTLEWEGEENEDGTTISHTPPSPVAFHAVFVAGHSSRPVQGQREEGEIQDNTAVQIAAAETKHCLNCNRFTRFNPEEEEQTCEFCSERLI